MSSDTIVRGLSVASFIEEYEDTQSEDGYMYAISKIYELHGVKNQLSAECQASHSDKPWNCMLARYASQHITTPLFFMNSQYDSWQLTNLLALGYNQIYYEQAGTGEYKDQVDSFGAEWAEQFEDFEALNGSKHAAYVVTCICHCYCGPDSGTFSDSFGAEW